MKYRVLSLLLALIMVLTLLPAGVSAIEYGPYEFDAESGTIVKYNLNTDAVTIPSEVPVGNQMVTVRAIGKDAFASHTSMKSVTIPNTVVHIGEQAFQNCSSLTSVTIKDGGKPLTIGARAFSGCGFTNIILPDSLVEIGENAFANCNLTGILIPKAVSTIGNFAFYNCSRLTTVSLSDETGVGSYVFAGAGTKIIHYCGSLTDEVAVALQGENLTIHPAISNTPAGTSSSCSVEGTTREDILCIGECNRIVLSAIRQLPLLPHEEEKIPEVPATCIMPGTTEGSRCTVCGNIVVAPRPIEPLGHELKDDLDSKVVEVLPNCKEDGYRTTPKICERCGEKTEETEILQKTVNHTYTTEFTSAAQWAVLEAATCTEDGKVLKPYVCDVCGQFNTIDSKHVEEHKKGAAKLEDCEDHLEVTVAALGHEKGTKWILDPAVPNQEYDCTRGSGTNTIHVIYQCTRCGEFPKNDASMKAEITATAGQHSYGDKIPIASECKDATCENDGQWVTERTCSVCGMKEGKVTEARPALGHNVTRWTTTKEPTCTQPGERSGLCENPGCGETITEAIEALGHDFESESAKQETTKAPSCTEEGLLTITCGRAGCDDGKTHEDGKVHAVTTTRPIDMLPHTPYAPVKATVLKEPTCTDEGSQVYDTKCSVCDTDLQNTPIPMPALGHSFGPWTTSGGVRTRTCQREGCGYSETDASITPSNPSDPGTPSTPGSSSSATYYSIDVIRPANGSISVSTSSARSGTRVTVTLRPNSGYQLDNVEVIRAGSGRVVSLSGEGTNRYSFLMPAARVEVRAVFYTASGTSANTVEPNDRNINPTKNLVINIPQISSASTPAGSRVFVDVPSTFWAQGEIVWACQRGFVSGSGGNFYPNNPITVRQLWMVMARMMGQNPANMEEARIWAQSNGFADGGNPNAALSRLQLTTMLYRCARLMGSTNNNTTNLGVFTDSRSIPAASKNAMAWAVANGILTGTTDGRLNPGGTVSRAQFCVILYRYYQRLF